MDHDGVVLGVVVPVEVELETLRQLEVQLDGSALVRALQSIEKLDVDLRAIERAVLWVELPCAREEIIERL